MAVSNIFSAPLGNGFTVYGGTITHTEGAAEETITLGSQRVYGLIVTNKSSSEAYESNPAKFSESVSGLTNTVTLHNLGTMADGRFVLLARA